MEKRQYNRPIFSGFALSERAGCAVASAPIGGLPMRTHDAAARRDPAVQHELHYRSLVALIRQTDRIALPIAPRKDRLGWNRQARSVRQQFTITNSQFTAASNRFRQALELHAAHRGLDIGHAVIVAELGIFLEDHLIGSVANSIRNAHAMLPQQPKLAVEFGIGGRQHTAVAGGDYLARMK